MSKKEVFKSRVYTDRPAYADFDYNEKGYFVDGCKLGYPEGSYENHWGDIIDCPEHEEAENEVE